VTAPLAAPSEQLSFPTHRPFRSFACFRGEIAASSGQCSLILDNGSGYVSIRFARLCRSAGVRHLGTRPYTPRTNGKAERFIQTLLREWAYRRAYPSSRHRTEALPAWLYYYNWERGHGALHGRPPMSRLVAPNNLVAVHS
jgi:transposase InsO family protein